MACALLALRDMGGGKRDSIAFAALTVFAVVMYTIPSEWIPALGPLRLAFVSSIIAASFMLVRRLGKREPFYFDGARGIALIAFGLLCYASASWSIVPEISRDAALEILKLVAIYLTMVNVITTPRRLVIFASAMVLSSIVTSWHVIDWYYSGQPLVEGFRARWLGVYMDPNHMAMDIGLVVPLAVASIARRGSPWWLRIAAIAAVILAVSSVVVSHSRGGFIGLVLAMGLWVFLEKSRRWITLTITACVAIGLVLFAPKTFWERNETLEDFQEDASAMGRVHAWEVGAKMNRDHPLLGVGIGAFVYNWPFYAPPDAHQAFVAHNVYLSVVGELGWLGLMLFLVFTGGAAGGALAATRDAEIGWLANGLVAAVCGYVVCSLFSGYTVSAHFYVLFGLAACADRIVRFGAAKQTALARPAHTPGPGAAAATPPSAPAWEL